MMSSITFIRRAKKTVLKKRINIITKYGVSSGTKKK